MEPIFVVHFQVSSSCVVNKISDTSKLVFSMLKGRFVEKSSLFIWDIRKRLREFT